MNESQLTFDEFVVIIINMDVVGSSESYYAKLQSAIGDKSIYVKYVSPYLNFMFVGPMPDR